MIDDEACLGAFACECGAVGQFAGSHAEVKAEVQFAEQLHGFDELSFKAHAGCCSFCVQHLSDSANFRGLCQFADVVTEGFQSGSSGNDCGHCGCFSGPADADQCFGFQHVIFRTHVDFHVDGLHYVQSGRGRCVLGEPVVLFQHLGGACQPWQLQFLQIPEVLVCVDGRDQISGRSGCGRAGTEQGCTGSRSRSGQKISTIGRNTVLIQRHKGTVWSGDVVEQGRVAVRIIWSDGPCGPATAVRGLWRSL